MSITIATPGAAMSISPISRSYQKCCDEKKDLQHGQNDVKKFNKILSVWGILCLLAYLIFLGVSTLTHKEPDMVDCRVKVLTTWVETRCLAPR